MYATNWHSDGLRWIAGLISDLADFLDRMDTSPGGRAFCASDACDEARSNTRLRAPYY